MIHGVVTLNRLTLLPSKVLGTSGSVQSWLRVSNLHPPVFKKECRIGTCLSASIHDLSIEDSNAKLLDRPKHHRKRKSNNFYIGSSKYHDLETYLLYTKDNKVSPNSTVFQGNLYELNFLEFLRQNFTVKRVIHQGGKGDRGVDIRATWLPTENFRRLPDPDDKKVMQSVNSVTHVKPICLKKNASIKLFIQCKSWEKSRIDAKLIREINGTFDNTGSGGSRPANGERTRRFLMIVCPTGFTRQGRIDFNRSLVPLIFIKFSKSVLRDGRRSPYNFDNYKFGSFQTFYCNPMATALLKGLNWMDFMKKLTDN